MTGLGVGMWLSSDQWDLSESSGKLPVKISLLFKETRKKYGPSSASCHAAGRVWKYRSHLTHTRTSSEESGVTRGQDGINLAPLTLHWINQSCSWPSWAFLVIWMTLFYYHLGHFKRAFSPLKKYLDSKRDYIKTRYSLQLWVFYLHGQSMKRDIFSLVLVLFFVISRL